MNMNQLADNSYGIIKNEFECVRVEPVDDPKLNSILFSLYKQLINPMCAIEGREEEILIKQAKIQEINGVIYNFFKRLLKLSIPFGIMSFVFWAFFEDAPPFNTFVDSFAEFSENIFIGLSNIGIPEFICLIVYFLIFFGGIYLLPIPIPVMILFLRNYVLKKKISKINREIKEIENDIEERIALISDVLSFVPPAYRYSEAVTYFVDSYANSRVSNLKEAVNGFDSYKHRQNVENSFNKIQKLLTSIAYNQLVQIEQLERINKKIWRTGVWF